MRHAQVVGTLLFRRQAEHSTNPPTLEIYAHKEIDVGRRHVQKLLDVNDSSISIHHLRFRCSIFDDDDPAISPAVYVQVISPSGRATVQGYKSQVVLTNLIPAYLLTDGDTLLISKRINITFRAAITSPRTPGLPSTPRAQRLLLSSTDKYAMTDHVIGKGATGSVLVAIRQRDERQFACKVMTRIKTVPDHTDQHFASRQLRLDREIEILNSLDHPNVVKTIDIVKSSSVVYIIQELATGGDLFSYLRLCKEIAEGEIMVRAFQLANAVKYLHDLGIVHRDIKPENVLLTSWRPGSRIMLTDFGQATHVGKPLPVNGNTEQIRMHSIVGTEGWVAPELKSRARSYGPAVDIWGLGCVTLCMFTRDMPESSAQALALTQTVSQELIDEARETGHHRTVSVDARSFMQACLVTDETQRMNASAALNHSWFNNSSYASELHSAYRHAISSWCTLQQPTTGRSHKPDIVGSRQYALTAIDLLHASPAVKQSLDLSEVDHDTYADSMMPSQSPIEARQTSYGTQATLLVDGITSMQQYTCSPTWDLDPPPSGQMEGVNFSNIPQLLLQPSDGLSSSSCT